MLLAEGHLPGEAGAILEDAAIHRHHLRPRLLQGAEDDQAARDPLPRPDLLVRLARVQGVDVHEALLVVDPVVPALRGVPGHPEPELPLRLAVVAEDRPQDLPLHGEAGLELHGGLDRLASHAPGDGGAGP